MIDARRTFRYALTILTAVVLVPVVSTFIVEWAREGGAFERPSAKMARVWHWLADLTQYWWFWLIFGVIVGGTIVLWIGSLSHRNHWQVRKKQLTIPIIIMTLGAILFIAGGVWFYISGHNKNVAHSPTHEISSVLVRGIGSYSINNGVPVMYKPVIQTTTVIQVGPLYITNKSDKRPVTLDIKAILENKDGGKLVLNGEGVHWLSSKKIGEDFLQPPGKGPDLNYLLSPLNLKPNETVYGRFPFISQPGDITNIREYEIRVQITDVASGEILTIPIKDNAQSPKAKPAK